MDEETMADIEILKNLYRRNKDKQVKEAINRLILAIVVMSHHTDDFNI